jgi:hypothetical protein
MCDVLIGEISFLFFLLRRHKLMYITRQIRDVFLNDE